jgi:acetyl esterase/lipase
MTRIDDVVYASPDDAPLLADVYLPDSQPAPWPTIVWLHAGGWRFGDRRLAPDLSTHFAQHGYAMVSIDYRLTDRAQFPAQIEDVKTAVRWIRASASHYGFDPARIGLWGASAGGHLAALAATSGPGIFENDGSEHAAWSSEVRAVVDGYGPVDFLQLDAQRDPSDPPSDDPESVTLPPGTRAADADSFESRLIGGPIGRHPDRVAAANPLSYTRPAVPPVLILHGTSDTTVPAHQSEMLFEGLAASGVDVTLCLIEGLGHGFLNRQAFGARGAGATTVRRAFAGAIARERSESPVGFETIKVFFDRVLAR